MKGHIAFCPHFHQPHFQLYKTREEAYRNSYLPWLDLLKKAVDIDGFYINLHLSGPLLYWLRDQKQSYIKGFKGLVGTNKIGLVGGLADEPFVQLSSRNDDFLYQLKKYEELLYELTEVKASAWQGIHVVERECGEITLKELTYAANLINSPAIFYLDAETFYESHFNYPGSDYDYCLKHFGFVDPVAKTTISHIPQKFLHYAFRDELVGQEFFSVPVHSQFRYQLLKRQSFTTADKVRIKPQHYYFYIKDALEEASKFAKVLGRDIPPILVIFEDAEKLGQWSKDPTGDVEWLLEFFELVAADDDLEFIGLKQYLDKYGPIDTYPVSLSHSYPEWENWTAKRGIRGVSFGDERLRRVICRLRDLEELQESYENEVINNFGQNIANIDTDIRNIIKRSILSSPERYELIEKMLKDEPEQLLIYEVVNRIRNLVYQEDPKWASRHPSYGSSPYYDVTGLAYLEIAYKVLQSLTKGKPHYPKVVETDWDYDGVEELLVENDYQTLVIDRKGGCISYHHILSPNLANKIGEMTDIIVKDSHIPAYNSIFRYAYPLVFTEADSDMALKFYDEGGRKEISRNSLRCNILAKDINGYKVIGDFASALFEVELIEVIGKRVIITLVCHQRINNDSEIVLRKTFVMEESYLSCEFEVLGQVPSGLDLYIAPQIVTSAAASDEVDFRPSAFIGVSGNSDTNVNIDVTDISVINENGIDYKSSSYQSVLPNKIDYLYLINSADNSKFWNLVSYNLTTDDEVVNLIVAPAVREYYKDYVFENQSDLGYHTSGVLIKPIIKVTAGQANLLVNIGWQLDTDKNENNYSGLYSLIEK